MIELCKYWNSMGSNIPDAFFAPFLPVFSFSGEFPSPSKSSTSVAEVDHAGSRTFRRNNLSTLASSSRSPASSESRQTRRSNTTTGPRHMLPMLSIHRYRCRSFVGKLRQRLLYPAPPTRLSREFSSKQKGYRKAEGRCRRSKGFRNDFEDFTSRWILVVSSLRKTTRFDWQNVTIDSKWAVFKLMELIWSFFEWKSKWMMKWPVLVIETSISI